MVRKNKAEGAEAEDMDMVVAIHNNMNESTWQAVMAWESLHEPPADMDPEDAKPTLLRFTGRPDEHSPKVNPNSNPNLSRDASFQCLQQELCVYSYSAMFIHIFALSLLQKVTWSLSIPLIVFVRITRPC